MAFLVLSVSLSAAAASDAPNANARYQADRATCNSGQSNQDRATCLKEAGAALQESRRGHLKDDPAANQRNTSLRCDALPADERDACQRRMEGEGETSGSVRDGGLIRELTVPDNK
ncbi:MAG TPA: hypothetical protein DEQ40_11280 [Oxalobacteraceae bacterium]|nr:hypothetical protein [Oxalobacteraceae bacterium]